MHPKQGGGRGSILDIVNLTKSEMDLKVNCLKKMFKPTAKETFHIY